MRSRFPRSSEQCRRGVLEELMQKHDDDFAVSVTELGERETPRSRVSQKEQRTCE